MTVARVARSVRNRSRAAAFYVRGLRLALLRAARQVEGGHAARLGRDVRLELYGRLAIGDRVVIEDGCLVRVAPGATLELGDDVYIGRHSVVAAESRLTIGSRTMIGEHASIRDADHNVDPGRRHLEWSGESENLAEPLHVGADVWIAAGARVLRGSSVGDGAVVAANAVVRDAVPSRCVAAGIPARVVRRIAD